LGKNSRERHKAKRKAAEAAHRRRSAGPADADDPLGLFGAPRIPSQLELAEQIIGRAIHAQHGAHSAELDRCRALLIAGPGGAVGIQVVNRALLARLLRDVEQAWRRGWQPAELVRVARRECTARHGRLMVDAIAAQMRGYPTATVDQRWQAQLAAVEALLVTPDRHVMVVVLPPHPCIDGRHLRLPPLVDGRPGITAHPRRDGIDHQAAVTCGALTAGHPDQLGRLPSAPPRLLHVAQQPGQQSTVDDLDPDRPAQASDQPGTAAVKLGAAFAVLGVDRLTDDLFREFELRRGTRCAEQAQRIIGVCRPRGPSAVRRFRRLPLGLVPLPTVLTH
jgi:hypothetical protein